ncbi:MAG: chromate efflux transporter [Candidatus Latescibacteria bacterium]|nr:chromate efflux transporter [Candidatus Latescibacterota bacterium]
MTRRLLETCRAFLKLGCTSFGGPIAHLGYFRAEFVQKRRWLSDEEYADLVALCQFLPGPASSQVVFALGMRQAGLPGALGASLCFTLPSALLLILFAYGMASLADLAHAGWLHGLKLAAAVVVAQAVWGMGKSLCPDRARLSLCAAAAAVLLVCPGALAQVGVIAAGGLLGWGLYRQQVVPPPMAPEEGRFLLHLVAAGALALFLVLLVLLPLAAASTQSKSLSVFDSFYRTGSLVFGGGHVILPLLHAEVVPRGWLSDDQFLAGYGAAQAVPGPLFTFSAYLGTAMSQGAHPWANGLWCLLAIFLPAWLLIGGALPFWHRLRSQAWAQASLCGANAAVVGVLLAALFQPVLSEAVRDSRDIAAVLLAFGALQVWKAPPWAVVLSMAGVGQWLLV